MVWSCNWEKKLELRRRRAKRTSAVLSERIYEIRDLEVYPALKKWSWNLDRKNRTKK